MPRIYGELHSITKLKDGQYRVHLCLDDDGIEEESHRDYSHLKDLPRCLYAIKDGKLTYRRGLSISVSLAYVDVYGINWFPDSIRLEK